MYSTDTINFKFETQSTDFIQRSTNFYYRYSTLVVQRSGVLLLRKKMDSISAETYTEFNEAYNILVQMYNCIK